MAPFFSGAAAGWNRRMTASGEGPSDDSLQPVGTDQPSRFPHRSNGSKWSMPAAKLVPFSPSLLRDAVLRTLQAADIAGIRAILVHAISERARQFYGQLGFVASPMDPMTLMITVSEAVKAFAEEDTK